MNMCKTCRSKTPGRHFCTKCGAAFQTSPPIVVPPAGQTNKYPPILRAMTRSRSMGSEPSFLLASSDKRSPFSVEYLRANDGSSRQLLQCVKSEKNIRSADTSADGVKRVRFSEEPQHRQLEDSVVYGSRLSLFKGHYADHPSCDLCFVNFDVTRRRRQWCVPPSLNRSLALGATDTRSGSTPTL